MKITKKNISITCATWTCYFADFQSYKTLLLHIFFFILSFWRYICQARMLDRLLFNTWFVTYNFLIFRHMVCRSSLAPPPGPINTGAGMYMGLNRKQCVSAVRAWTFKFKSQVCYLLAGWLNFWEPQFPHLQNGQGKNLAHIICSVNVYSSPLF